MILDLNTENSLHCTAGNGSIPVPKIHKTCPETVTSGRTQSFVLNAVVVYHIMVWVVSKMSIVPGKIE